MRKLRLYIFLFLCSFSASASHIVGGGFTMSHITGDQYRVQLEFYRDCSSQAEFDDFINAGIYDKATNQLVEVVSLIPGNIQRIDFGNTDCIVGASTCLEKRIYTDVVSLTPDQYNNVAGYYISWERCCRNNAIDNIEVPGQTGMVFYMEFPSPYAPTVPATGLINSSPRFTVDPINYICINNEFKYNFNAVDDDGDSLVFSLITPLAGHTSEVMTNTSNTMFEPAPYDPVLWGPGYGLGINIMDGTPDLAIDRQTGEFSVTPKFQGLYVFTILCEEYRNGEKIGQIRRDIQYTTVLCWPQAAPKITTTSIPATGLTANLNEEKCFQISGTDSNMSDSVEIVYLGTTEGKSFSSHLLTDAKGIKNVTARFCFTPMCTDNLGDSVHLVFRIKDNSCPKPLSTTITIPVKLINNSLPPQVTTNALPSDTIHVNETRCFDVFGNDPNDTDAVVLSFLGLEEESVLYEYTFNDTAGIKNVSSSFCFTPRCIDATSRDIHLIFIAKDNTCPESLYDTIIVPVHIINSIKAPQVFDSLSADMELSMGEKRCFRIYGTDANISDSLELYFDGTLEGVVFSGFEFERMKGVKQLSGEACITVNCDDNIEQGLVHLRFIIKDNSCPQSLYDTLVVPVLIKDANKAPEIVAGVSTSNLYLNLNERKCFPIFGLDSNLSDSIEISFLGFDGGKDIFDFSFQSVKGIKELSTQVCMMVTCDDRTGPDVRLRFLIKDNAFCPLGDTLVMELEIRDGNVFPDIYTDAGTQHIEVHRNEEKCIPIYGNDINLSDSIKITYLGAEGPAQLSNFSFNEVTGLNTISTEACFRLMCYDEIQNNTVSLRFLIKDNSCIIPGTDTLTVEVSVLDDRNQIDLSVIPNVFTPNGDNKNDFFQLPDYDQKECLKDFEINIYNRWGKKVYESTDPLFVWNGEGLPPETYFYVIRINKDRATGNVVILR